MSGLRYRAPRGTQLNLQELADRSGYRDDPNNLDPEVAEKPEDLVVYGGRGQLPALEAFDAILNLLRSLNEDETLLVQSGKPVAIFKTHPDAPRVLIANSNLVPHWATQEHFDELAAKGLIMYGTTRRALDLHWHARHLAGHLRNFRFTRPKAWLVLTQR